ncbi:MAG: hypothetical protein ACLTCI_02395 [[Clostridium] nexile]
MLRIDSCITESRTVRNGSAECSFRLFRIINILEQRVLWQTKMYSMAEINAKKLSCLKLETVTGVVVKLQTPLRIRRVGN